MKTYELTVYHTVDNCGYPVAYKSFNSIYDLLLYCADFNTEDENILFDVWEDSAGQFNVNEAVGAVIENRRANHS